MVWLDSFLRVSQGEIWVSATLQSFLEIPGNSPASTVTQIVGGIQFLWLLAGSRGLLLSPQPTLRAL